MGPPHEEPVKQAVIIREAQLHEGVDQRPVVPLGRHLTVGDFEHDRAGDVDGAPGGRQRLGLGAEDQPVGLAEGERAGVGAGQPGLQERHSVIGGQVARMESEVGETLQHEAEGGQPGPGVDRLRPTGRVDSGVGRVAGGQGLGVVAVVAVDHPVDEGGGVHQRSSFRGRG
jgi:hypothetical protein